MKKNVDFVTADLPLLAWLLGKLENYPQELQQAGELLQGLRHLLQGQSSSLILETGPQANRENKLVCKDLTIWPQSRRVARQGIEISLTPKEFDILYFLVQNQGEVFTKEQIYQAVWDEHYLMDDSNIMAFIRKLRKKIEPHPDAPEYILTIWGVGYKFNDRL